FHHRSSPRAKRVTTATTAIALPLAIMDANVALSDLASCGTRQVWAKLSGRVHWLLWCVLPTPKMPRTVEFFKRGLLFHRLGGLYPKKVSDSRLTPKKVYARSIYQYSYFMIARVITC